jgi:hypothetical protein
MIADLYRVSLSIPPHQNLPGPILTYGDLRILELSALIPGVDVLVGMDVVLTCILTLNGPAQSFSLDF